MKRGVGRVVAGALCLSIAAIHRSEGSRCPVLRASRAADREGKGRCPSAAALVIRHVGGGACGGYGRLLKGPSLYMIPARLVSTGAYVYVFPGTGLRKPAACTAAGASATKLTSTGA